MIRCGNEALTSAAISISWTDGQAKVVSAQAQHLPATTTNYANVHCPGDGNER
jgi:hypothetical protein